MTSHLENLMILREGKKRRKYLPIYINISEKFYFSHESSLYSFWRKSQLIKYSKWRTEISKICIFELNFSVLLGFQNKIYFCNQHDRLIQKIYIFVCLSVHFRFEKFYFRFTLKRQYL